MKVLSCDSLINMKWNRTELASRLIYLTCHAVSHLNLLVISFSHSQAQSLVSQDHK